MAGGKESPRNKMIGMMYLVLTALLALNVSSTVLDKFAFINSSLEKANAQTHTRNDHTIRSIAQAIKEKGDRGEDLKVLEDAEKLKKETEEVYRVLESYKDTFVNITGGFDEEYGHDRRFIIGKTDYERVGHYMMPEREGGKGHGEVVQKMLNSYATNISGLLKKYNAPDNKVKSFSKLAKDAEEDEYFKNDPNQDGKSWSTLSFDGSPTHAGLATLSEIQAQVLGYETSALEYLSAQVGLKDIAFDRITPVVMPQSKIVAAGTKYEAEMFIAASASALDDKIIMKYAGKKISVSNGKGKVEFVATPPKEYDENNLARKTFKAEITVPLGGGSDTTFSDDIEYFVVKPVIQIQSQSVNALYLNCGNALDVQVPALGTLYNPNFTAKGGDAIKGAEKGQVTVVPQSKNVVLTVSSGGNPIGSREFGVRKIPSPTIRLKTDAGEVNLKDGISAKTPRLYLSAIPDESFAQFLPDDAKFRISQAEVTLVSGGLGRGSARGGKTLNLSGISARKGDQLVIEIKKVERQNFRKQVEDFPIPTASRFINISVK